MVRAFTVEPSAGRWKLTLIDENGIEAGGGVYPMGGDASGFDAGFQDASDAGQRWIA